MESAADPATLFDLGNTLLEQGDATAAATAFERCSSIVPNHAGVRYNWGNALLAAKRPVEATKVFVSCLRLAPDFGAAYVNLANTLRQLASLDHAQAMAELGIRYLPDVPEARISLANVLHDKGEYSAAATLYRRVLRQVPDHAGALSSLGNTLRALGRFTDALAAHERAAACAPADPEIRFSRATALLAAGDFARGWEEYEWRWKRSSDRSRGFGKAWRGENIAGRTILLHAEQGLGDTLQFVRYAPLVVKRGARVILEVQPELLRLMQGLPGVAQVVARGDVLPAFDVHCPLLSLPLAFRTRLETIPPSCPYVRTDPVAAAAWGAKLPVGRELRVGLCWAGSAHADHAATHLMDQRRSVGLHLLTSLGDIPGIHLISLQKDRAADASADLRLMNLMPAVTDFADTAALVANLDLVISVDTAVAHLAGALDRPVWLLSRYDGCWRWLHARHDSPWYPELRIFRQAQPHDWSVAIRRIRTDLSALAQGPFSR